MDVIIHDFFYAENLTLLNFYVNYYYYSLPLYYIKFFIKNQYRYFSKIRHKTFAYDQNAATKKSFF